MNAMEKEMTHKLEKAIQEIKQLRQENAQLRKKLGIEVSEPKADYRQSALTSLGSNAGVEEFQEARSYRGYEPVSGKPTRVGSNSSAEEKIKLFRTLFKGREDVYAVFWFNERTGKKGYSPACENPWSSKKGKAKKYLALTDEVILSHLTGEKIIGITRCLKMTPAGFLLAISTRKGGHLMLWRFWISARITKCQPI